MPKIDFTPQPHEEAMALIKGKPAVSRAVFDQILPELRARVFTITGIESANTLQRARDIIAKLPEGHVWSEVRDELVDQISPYLSTGDNGGNGDEAERRAEILMRTHGFQAFQAANWRTAQEDGDTTHLQYLATEDSHVRDSHIALNGLILPKTDSFWEKHTPPWEWGCRCRIRAMNPDLVDEARQEDESRAPENRLVMDGAAAEQLRNGTLMRNGQRFDVTPPSDRPDENGTPYVWHPDNLTISLEELKGRYDPEVFSVFEQFAGATEIVPGTTLLDWMEKGNLTTEAQSHIDGPGNLTAENAKNTKRWVANQFGDYVKGEVTIQRPRGDFKRWTIFRNGQPVDTAGTLGEAKQKAEGK